MLRLLGVGLLLSCAVGCVSGSFVDLDDTVPVSTETEKKVDDLGRKLQVALQNKDWDAVPPLYWSGAQMTSEKAKAQYETYVTKAGSMQNATIEYTAYDTADLPNEVGDDVLQAIGAPHELWRGFADIFYVDPTTNDELAVTLEIGEENGQYVILGVYEIDVY